MKAARTICASDAAIGLGAVNSLLVLVGPWALGVIINKVIVPADPTGVAPGSGMRSIFALGATYVSLVLSSGRDLRDELHHDVVGSALPRALAPESLRPAAAPAARKFRPLATGRTDLARFNSDLQVMSDAVSVSLPQLINALLTAVSSLAAMVYIDWLLTLVLMVIAPLLSFAVSRFQKLISTSMSRSQSRIANLSATLTEILQAQRIVKAFGREDLRIATVSAIATTITSAHS